MKKITSCFILLISLLITAILSAATIATLRGVVTDASTGAPLQNANIVLEGTGLGGAADAGGQYIISDITPGTYTLKATRIGYEPVVLKDIRLGAGDSKTLNIKLTPGVINMRDVSVEADKFQTRCQDINRAGSQSLQPRNINKIAGSLDDITRAVQLFGSAVPAGDYTSFYAVRGGSPDQNIVMLDGLVVPNPYRLRMIIGGGVSIFNQYTTRDVELYTGNFPAEYGNFLSSVMGVKSRDGRTDRIGYGGSANFLNANAYVEGPWPGGKGSWIFSARRSYFDLLANRFDKDQTSYPHTFDVDTKLTYFLSKNLKLTFKTLFSREGTELGSLDKEDIGLKENSDINLYTLSLDYFPTEKILEKIDIAYYDEQFDYKIFYGDDPSESNIYVYGDFKSKIYTTTIKEDFSYRITPDHSINRGMQFLLDRSSMDLATDVRNITFARRDVPPVVYFNKTSGHFNTYIDYSGRPVAFLQAKIGARYDYSFLINRGDISPRASLLWNVTENLSLNGFWGVCHQYPNVFSVFNRDWPLNIAANLDGIQSEKATHTVLGITKLWGKNYLTRIEAYYKDIDRLLLPRDYVYYIPENSGSGYAKGLELQIEKGENAGSRWNAMLSYAWSISRYRERNAAWVPFNFDRRHGITAFGKVKLLKNLTASGTWRYASGLPYNTIIAYINAGFDGSKFIKTTDNVRRYPYYQRFDIRLNYEVQTGRGLLNVYLDMTNILNRKNIYDQAWYKVTDDIESAEEQPFLYGEQDILIQRNIYMLPFVPSLGVSYNF
ncbi:TonB-dependent receptor [candidate division KSB1 bacterium]|nr:TonB-dependent receptor [candidate division KSB1 bacterium]